MTPNLQAYQPRIPVATEADQIPPYGIVRLVSFADGEWTIAAPASDDEPHVYVLGDKTLTNESGDKASATFAPLGRVAYDPTDGEPILNEEWGPKAGEFLLRKGYLGFRCAGAADGFTAVFARIPNFFEEGYDTYYGSYDDGDGGTSWSHEATLNLGCDTTEASETEGKIVYDRVRYTVVLIMRNRRPFASISMEVLEENKVAVDTTCKEFLTKDSTVACVDGDIVFTKVTEKVRVISCVACP
ncbi:MAG: hypothetical protein E6R03_01260 [Hyphomicrobiaceae bacterium]|nr:MAG: hypothetical protein E6R03_01260 [Hyphomicrobiaceae bacterium]